MRIFAYLSIVILLSATSCAETRKTVSNSSVLYSYDSIPGISIKRSQIPAVLGRQVEEEPVRKAEEDIFRDAEKEPAREAGEKTVREVEERLVSNDQKKPGPGKNKKGFEPPLRYHAGFCLPPGLTLSRQ